MDIARFLVQVLRVLALCALMVGATAANAQAPGEDVYTASWRGEGEWFGPSPAAVCDAIREHTVRNLSRWQWRVFLLAATQRYPYGLCRVEMYTLDGGAIGSGEEIISLLPKPRRVAVEGPLQAQSGGAEIVLVATVRDNAPVANVGVGVSVLGDAGGHIKSVDGATDAQGRVRIVYVPPPPFEGSTRTEKLQVHCVGCSNSQIVAITVLATMVPPEPTVPEMCVADPGLMTPNPIALTTGVKLLQHTDLADSSPHPIAFTRYYASRWAAAPEAGLGANWSHEHAHRIAGMQNDRVRTVVFGDGRISSFTNANASPDWRASGSLDTMAVTPQGIVVQRAQDDSTWLFDAATGRVLSQRQRNGWSYSYTYSGDRLVRVTNAFGRSLDLQYDGAGRLVGASSSGGSVAFGFDAVGRLALVTQADGTTQGYRYEDARWPQAITGVIDETGRRKQTVAYDEQGRAVLSELAGGVQRRVVGYGQQASSVTDARGSTRTYGYQPLTGAAKGLRTRSASAPANDGNAIAAQEFDSASLLASQTDFLGVTTMFTWDAARRLPLSQTRAAGRPEQQSTQTEWHPALRLPVKITEAGRTTEFTYDGLGNLLKRTVTDVQTGEQRTWRWTYGANNLPSAARDPKGGEWSFGYDALGNRTSVKDPAGRETLYAYDAAGRITLHTAPGGLRTQYTYDALGRVAAQTRGSEATQYAWTLTGQLASVTFATGYSVRYGYDDAQRLVSAADNRGATITYTLDAEGNRTAKEVRDGSGQIALATRTVIDALSRVSSTQSMQFAYDANGELVSQTDALNQTTRQTLDALRRTTATTFPDNASVTQGWNALDQLTQLTDPKGVATSYTYNAFGEVTSETSSDIGTMTFTRDANGDITSTRDAKGQLTQIDRDALGRITRIAYADSTSRSFTYDAAGEVSRIEDRSGSTNYERDAHGRILAKTQDVNDSATPSRFRVGYSYTAGALAGIAYPSGLKVFYRRTNGRITAIDIQEPGGTVRKPKPVTPFVTDLTHTALGQPKSWRWFTGDAASRGFDSEGRMTSNEFASYVYDAAGRITGITQHLWTELAQADGSLALSTTPFIWQAGYDARNRLVSFTRDGAETRYTYDANSNRLTAVDVVTSDTDLDGEFDLTDFSKTTRQVSNVESSSNRLLGLTQTISTFSNGKTRTQASTTVNYTVDANGSMASDGLRDFVYGADGRLQYVRAFRNGEAAIISYLVNGFGQRVFKGEPAAEQTIPSEAALGTDFITWLKKQFGWLFTQAAASTSVGTAYVYGDSEIPSWALLGEYDNGSASGKGRTEYIWLPTEDGSAIPIGLYRNGNFFAIHTDHLGTPRLMTSEAKKVVWQWPYSTFGQNKPTGLLRATPNPKAAITNKPLLLKATAATEMNLRFLGQYVDAETGLAQNSNREYGAWLGRYIQSDPAGLFGGLNVFAYVDADPLRFTDPTGLVKHVSGQWIDCGKGCRIRIDFTLDEKTGVKRRHLHWECSANEGSCGENGELSHGGSWDSAPEHIKKCALKNGFNGASPSATAPLPAAGAPRAMPSSNAGAGGGTSWMSAPMSYDPKLDMLVPSSSAPAFLPRMPVGPRFMPMP